MTTTINRIRSLKTQPGQRNRRISRSQDNKRSQWISRDREENKERGIRTWTYSSFPDTHHEQSYTGSIYTYILLSILSAQVSAVSPKYSLTEFPSACQSPYYSL